MITTYVHESATAKLVWRCTTPGELPAIRNTQVITQVAEGDAAARQIMTNPKAKAAYIDWALQRDQLCLV